VANMIQLVGSEEEARLLIGEADFHHNHAINYDEFRRLMRLPEHKELISQDDLSMNSLERLARKWYEAPEDDKQYVDRTFTGYQEGFQLCMIQLPQRGKVNFITRIEENTPADQAQVHKLDILLKIDDIDVVAEDLSEAQIVQTMHQIADQKNQFTITVGILPSTQEYQRVRRHDSSRAFAQSFNSS